jgi:predicted HTH transcriptional regulator
MNAISLPPVGSDQRPAQYNSFLELAHNWKQLSTPAKRTIVRISRQGVPSDERNRLPWSQNRTENGRLVPVIEKAMAVLNFIKENPCCTTSEIAASLTESCTYRTVHRYLKALIQLGAIERNFIKVTRDCKLRRTAVYETTD